MSQGPADVPRPRLGAAAAPRCARGAEQALDRGYADPRRLHRPAREARLMLDNARAVVAECLGVRPDEVTFTPSGTHAVHLGVLGLLAGRARQGDLLLASSVEHSAVLHAGAWHAARGGRFETVAVDRHGRVAPSSVAAAAAEHGRPAVVALQSANPEVGVRPTRGRGCADDPRGAAVRGRVRLRRAAPAARRLGSRRRLGPQVGRTGRGRRAPGAPLGPLAQPVPGRRARRRAGHRVRERPGRARRGRSPARQPRGTARAAAPLARSTPH